ncbi:hypothetical protein L873DRAFT_824508 [Choiromyces venosus 120613-1]|uniref:Uncharacterized protein n=1 Tax=Choiromyces venosus 120613-1 TaxID=1336337 RepID=A0A3N4JPT9_9PEZI|nr:hypothetical protein L873DRAFT_824508 [Choiromyces venosus 120613-1]
MITTIKKHKENSVYLLSHTHLLIFLQLTIFHIIYLFISSNFNPFFATPYADLSYLAAPAVLRNDCRPSVSRTGVDRILPPRPVQGSWQSPRRALRGPQTVENTGRICNVHFKLLFSFP